ncbi:MAG: helix-turn-helix domain-containing protein [Gemmataceae bacterium]
MPRTKSKREERAGTKTLPVSPEPNAEVLTLREAAAYLKMAEADVLRWVEEQALPARRMGNEWRFLKTAIQQWLRTGPPPKPSKQAQLAVIGSWKDDPYLEEELKEIHRRRGRPMTEDES